MKGTVSLIPCAIGSRVPGILVRMISLTALSIYKNVALVCVLPINVLLQRVHAEGPVKYLVQVKMPMDDFIEYLAA